MKFKTHVLVFKILLLLFAVILLSPLSYTNCIFDIIHFWILIIYGMILLFAWTKNRKYKLGCRIVSISLLPFLAFFSALIYVMTPNNVKIVPLPNSSMKITYNAYSLLMAGNPRIKASIGYTFLGDAVIWEVNTYSNDGGEAYDTLDEYDLPSKYYHGESMILFSKEGYLYDGYRNKVIQKRTNKNPK